MSADSLGSIVYIVMVLVLPFTIAVVIEWQDRKVKKN